MMDNDNHDGDDNRDGDDNATVAVIIIDGMGWSVQQTHGQCSSA